jgi:hypothetical protein
MTHYRELIWCIKLEDYELRVKEKLRDDKFKELGI